MRLKYNTVSENLLEILRKLMGSDIFKDFRLVGGTSLSLQRGHRQSVDIDLFTDLDYGTMPLSDMKNFLEQEFRYHEGSETLSKNALGYHIRLGNSKDAIIKVDFFYTEKFVFDVLDVDGLRLADERDIAAMKLLAISGPIKRQKDYWDIHDLLDDYSLKDMIDWSLKQNEFSLSYDDIISGLKAIDTISDTNEGIIPIKPLTYWELIVMDLKDELAQLK